MTNLQNGSISTSKPKFNQPASSQLWAISAYYQENDISYRSFVQLPLHVQMIYAFLPQDQKSADMESIKTILDSQLVFDISASHPIEYSLFFKEVLINSFATFRKLLHLQNSLPSAAFDMNHHSLSVDEEANIIPEDFINENKELLFLFILDHLSHQNSAEPFLAKSHQIAQTLEIQPQNAAIMILVSYISDHKYAPALNGIVEHILTNSYLKSIRPEALLLIYSSISQAEPGTFDILQLGPLISTQLLYSVVYTNLPPSFIPHLQDLAHIKSSIFDSWKQFPDEPQSLMSRLSSLFPLFEPGELVQLEKTMETGPTLSLQGIHSDVVHNNNKLDADISTRSSDDGNLDSIEQQVDQVVGSDIFSTFEAPQNGEKIITSFVSEQDSKIKDNQVADDVSLDIFDLHYGLDDDSGSDFEDFSTFLDESTPITGETQVESKLDMNSPVTDVSTVGLDFGGSPQHQPTIVKQTTLSSPLEFSIPAEETHSDIFSSFGFGGDTSTLFGHTSTSLVHPEANQEDLSEDSEFEDFGTVEVQQPTLTKQTTISMPSTDFPFAPPTQGDLFSSFGVGNDTDETPDLFSQSVQPQDDDSDFDFEEFSTVTDSVSNLDTNFTTAPEVQQPTLTKQTTISAPSSDFPFTPPTQSDLFSSFGTDIDTSTTSDLFSQPVTTQPTVSIPEAIKQEDDTDSDFEEFSTVSDSVSTLDTNFTTAPEVQQPTLTKQTTISAPSTDFPFTPPTQSDLFSSFGVSNDTSTTSDIFSQPVQPTVSSSEAIKQEDDSDSDFEEFSTVPDLKADNISTTAPEFQPPTLTKQTTISAPSSDFPFAPPTQGDLFSSFGVGNDTSTTSDLFSQPVTTQPTVSIPEVIKQEDDTDSDFEEFSTVSDLKADNIPTTESEVQQPTLTKQTTISAPSTDFRFAPPTQGNMFSSFGVGNDTSTTSDLFSQPVQPQENDSDSDFEEFSTVPDLKSDTNPPTESEVQQLILIKQTTISAPSTDFPFAPPTQSDLFSSFSVGNDTSATSDLFSQPVTTQPTVSLPEAIKQEDDSDSDFEEFSTVSDLKADNIPTTESELHQPTLTKQTTISAPSTDFPFAPPTQGDLFSSFGVGNDTDETSDLFSQPVTTQLTVSIPEAIKQEDDSESDFEEFSIVTDSVSNLDTNFTTAPEVQQPTLTKQTTISAPSSDFPFTPPTQGDLFSSFGTDTSTSTTSDLFSQPVEPTISKQTTLSELSFPGTTENIIPDVADTVDSSLTNINIDHHSETTQNPTFSGSDSDSDFEEFHINTPITPNSQSVTRPEMTPSPDFHVLIPTEILRVPETETTTEPEPIQPTIAFTNFDISDSDSSEEDSSNTDPDKKDLDSYWDSFK